MTFSSFRLLFLGLFLCSVYSLTTNAQTEILWDDWGVPHIYAESDEKLYFATGYAQMQLRPNVLLELYGRSRGRAAEYWGAEYLESDVLVHTLEFPELADRWTAEQDPELKRIISAYVQGINAFAEAHPDAIEERLKPVLPIVEKDVNQHGLFVIYTRFIGGSELGMVQRWSDKGSNAYAVSGSRSASGNAMLVQNPHLPWSDEFLWVEMQAVTPFSNLYGATLIGFPMIAIGFNEYHGWTHTDNTIDNADTYELELSGDGYLLDGAERAFTKRTVTLKVKGEDGSLSEQPIELYRSEHGPVVKRGENKALAVRMVGYDRPNAFLQWVRMGRAKNFDEFERALKMAQIPFWNVMYADAEDNIFYLFNGLVPERSQGDWSYWNSIIDGTESENIWDSVHPYADLPKVKNPEQGWLQNSNDPPWTSTVPLALNPADFPPYMAPQGMSFRPQQSALMLSGDESITFEELVGYKLSTRMAMADRILDDLFAAIDAHGGELAQEAKAVLEAWDRQANPNSTGALLFSMWAGEARLWSDATYDTPWNPDQALQTPDGLADPEAAVRTLEAVAGRIKEQAGTLAVPWGDVYRIDYNGIELPGNGSSGYLGVVRVAWPDRTENGITTIGGGDSWVGIIEFGERLRAKVLLSYGNSSRPDSKHNGDQLQLFSERKMRDAYYYRDQLLKHLDYKEVLQDGVFVEK